MKQRASGIILHLTSLPSSYGIGDMGPSAYHFANFLQESGQRYWQILPLSPVDERNAYSPYSGLSAFAGNTLLISPDFLRWDKYLSDADLQNTYYFRDSFVDYSLVSYFKEYLFEKAFANFKKEVNPDHVRKFAEFCQEHSLWLEDYALFVAIRNHYDGKTWDQWPPELRDRDPDAIRHIKTTLSDSIEKEKFLQFIFFRQWFELKKYCSDRKINFIGDLPIYVSYDSADVWANPGFFKLDSEKRPTVVSGVPPDYFSQTGQLWNTPIFKWDVMKQTNYDWWIKRMSHNLRLCDMVRLDHFRAFSAFWEVPAEHKTAIDGYWVKGPGADFFNLLKREFPNLPIIAEDLGTIDDDVIELMDQFELPGMKVLLFAFGGGMPDNPYILHNHVKNCIVYTGTHDNNTIKGWYLNEADDENKRNLSIYLNQEVTAANVHEKLILMAMMSVANIAIFPLQDFLGLGQEAIMNRPSTTEGNWRWRYIPDQLTGELANKIFNWVKIYNR